MVSLSYLLQITAFDIAEGLPVCEEYSSSSMLWLYLHHWQGETNIGFLHYLLIVQFLHQCAQSVSHFCALSSGLLLGSKSLTCYSICLIFTEAVLAQLSQRTQNSGGRPIIIMTGVAKMIIPMGQQQQYMYNGFISNLEEVRERRHQGEEYRMNAPITIVQDTTKYTLTHMTGMTNKNRVNFSIFSTKLLGGH
ncbi:hypothetical protein ACJX0J_017718 [Zea mays]